MESLFSGIDSCSLTAVSSARVLNFIHLFLLSLLIFFFQIDRLELSFTDSVSVSVSVLRDSVSRFRIPSFTPGGRGTLRVRVN